MRSVASLVGPAPADRRLQRQGTSSLKCGSSAFGCSSDIVRKTCRSIRLLIHSMLSCDLIIIILTMMRLSCNNLKGRETWYHCIADAGSDRRRHVQVEARFPSVFTLQFQHVGFRA